jgi:transcriptional regulator with XRE-family HTH domain
MVQARSLTQVVGRRVQQRRHELNLTQTQLATRAGLHKNSIGTLERGQARDIELTTLDAIARALDTDLARLLGSASTNKEWEARVDEFRRSHWGAAATEKQYDTGWLYRAPIPECLGAQPSNEMIFDLLRIRACAVGSQPDRE